MILITIVVVHPFSGDVAVDSGSVRTFVVQQTVAISLKTRVRNLIPKFFTHAAVFLRAGDPAGAVAAGFFQSFLDGLYDFLVFVESDSHGTNLHFPVCDVVTLADVDWTELYQYRQSGGRECNGPASIILPLRKMATSVSAGP